MVCSTESAIRIARRVSIDIDSESSCCSFLSSTSALTFDMCEVTPPTNEAWRVALPMSMAGAYLSVVYSNSAVALAASVIFHPDGVYAKPQLAEVPPWTSRTAPRAWHRGILHPRGSRQQVRVLVPKNDASWNHCADKRWKPHTSAGYVQLARQSPFARCALSCWASR